MPYLTVGNENTSDIKLHYEDHGTGETILMIHGFPFSGRAWEKEERYFLENSYRVITYDRRGFGLSSHPSSGYNWDTFAEDLESVITQLDLDNITLVGHSMGTGEITRYLSRFGNEKVARVVLISPIPPYLLKTDDNPNGVPKAIFEDFKDAIKNDRYAFITTFLENFYSLGKTANESIVSEEKLKADFNLASSSSPIAMLKCVDTWIDDFRWDLRGFELVKTLIIQGDNDKILPIEVTGEELAKNINARIKIIPGGSHGIPWTHADKINDAILDFIFETEGRFIPENFSTNYQGTHDLK